MLAPHPLFRAPLFLSTHTAPHSRSPTPLSQAVAVDNSRQQKPWKEKKVSAARRATIGEPNRQTSLVFFSRGTAHCNRERAFLFFQKRPHHRAKVPGRRGRECQPLQAGPWRALAPFFLGGGRRAARHSDSNVRQLGRGGIQGAVARLRRAPASSLRRPNQHNGAYSRADALSISLLLPFFLSLRVPFSAQVCRRRRRWGALSSGDGFLARRRLAWLADLDFRVVDELVDLFVLYLSRREAKIL